MGKYKKLSHVVYKCEYHIVWAPKYRFRILTGEIKKLVEASQQKADRQAGVRLRERVRLTMKGHCTMCGACTQNCPQGLEVADVVRCSDYYLENAEYVETAFETYRALSRAPSRSKCGNCDLCERACRNGVPVVHHIHRAETALA